MNKKAIVGISALAISGVLFGGGLTSTAAAATPTTATAASDHAPHASQSFHLTNGFYGVTLELVGVYGKTEGRPPIGSTITYGQEHNFEVQYLFFTTSDVFVTYQVNSGRRGPVGDIQIRMQVGPSGETRSRLTVNNTDVKMHLAGSDTDAIIRPGNGAAR